MLGVSRVSTRAARALGYRRRPYLAFVVPAPAVYTMFLFLLVAVAVPVILLWRDLERFLPAADPGAGCTTRQVGVNNLRGFYSTDWGNIFAGVTLSALPVLVAYWLLTKQFIRGLSAGALKG
jgi:raffinose/stachyose/melibiose transport system permease protein